MVKKISKKVKDDTNNLFEEKKHIEKVNGINEPNVSYARSYEIQKKLPESATFEKRSFSSKSNVDNIKSNYLASSINFLSFLSASFNISNLKIIPVVEAFFIISALQRVNSQKSIDNLISKYISDNYVSDVKLRELAIIFFNYITDKNDDASFSTDSKKTNSLLKKLLDGIEETKKGKKDIQIVLDFLNKSKETKKFIELNKFIHENKTNEFSQLNEIADKLITSLSTTKLDDNYLQNWKIVIGSYIWVLRYSTQSIEVLIDDLLKKKSSQFKELHIVLIGLFAIKLFHSTPSWKPIGLSYQLHEKMKVLQPVAEVFYNPSIITSLSSDPKKQEEYFWTYVWGKPYSIFEKPEVKQVKKPQKRQIEVEEEVIIEEKTFGNFITVTSEPKPTGIIHIKTKI